MAFRIFKMKININNLFIEILVMKFLPFIFVFIKISLFYINKTYLNI